MLDGIDLTPVCVIGGLLRCGWVRDGTPLAGLGTPATDGRLGTGSGPPQPGRRPDAGPAAGWTGAGVPATL